MTAPEKAGGAKWLALVIAAVGIAIYALSLRLTQGIAVEARGFNAVFVAGSLVWLAGVVLVERKVIRGQPAGSRRRPVVLAIAVIGGAAAMRLVLIPAAPVISDDAYRYVWDGRVQAAGINPYLYAPNAPELAFLVPEAPERPLINRSDWKTIYPPVAEFAYRISFAAGLDTVQKWKVVAVLADLAGCLITWRRVGARSIWYAWHPLPILAFGHSGNVDALMVPLVASELAVFAGIAAAIKPYAGAAAVGRGVRYAAMAFGAFLLTYVPFLLTDGENVIGSIRQYIAEEGYVSGDRFLLLSLFGLGSPLVAVPLVLLCLAIAWRRREPLLGFVALFLVATPVQPWYICPLLALILVRGGSRRWFVYALGTTLAFLLLVEGYGEAFRVVATISAAAALVAAVVAWRHRLARSPGVLFVSRDMAPDGLDPTTVALVLPALNEEAALPGVIASVPDGVRVIVVDNGSTDETAAVARKHGAEVVAEERRGFGHACYAGLVAAGESGGIGDRSGGPAEIVAFCDADASFDTGELWRVVGPVARDEADVVLGTRPADSLGAAQRKANRVLMALCRLLFGMRFGDLGPFRAARREALMDLGLKQRGTGWPLEMLTEASRHGLRIGEVGVTYRARIGESKVTGTLGGFLKTSLRMSTFLAGAATRPAMALDGTLGASRAMEQPSRDEWDRA